jgi:hypothetical protein
VKKISNINSKSRKYSIDYLVARPLAEILVESIKQALLLKTVAAAARKDAATLREIAGSVILIQAKV